MKILITGGRGFIGSRLAKSLSKEHDIYILDSFNRNYPGFGEIHRGSEGLQPINEIEFLHREQALKARNKLIEYIPTYSKWSFELDKFKLPVKPDLIINCGNLSEAILSQHYNKFCFDSIVKGTRLLKQTFPKVKMIHFSSSMVYGTWKDSITEEYRTNPVDWYGTCKLMAETLLDNTKDIILRPIHVYGFMDGKFPITMNIDRQIAIDKPVLVEPAGCMYIYDLVNLIKKVIANYQPGTYNVSSDFLRDPKVVKKVSKDILDKNIEVKEKSGPTGFPRCNLDNNKIKTVFNWTSEYENYEDTIKDYFKEYIRYNNEN